MQRYFCPGYEINLCVTVCSQMWIYSNLKIILKNTASKDLPCIFSCPSESSCFCLKQLHSSFSSYFLVPAALVLGFLVLSIPGTATFPTFQGEATQWARSLLCSRRQVNWSQCLIFPQVPSKRCVVQQWIKWLHSRRFPLAMCLPSCIHLNFESKHIRTSLGVQWLRLGVPNARGLGSTPSQGTRSHMPQVSSHATSKGRLKIARAATKTWHSQINNKYFLKNHIHRVHFS